MRIRRAVHIGRRVFPNLLDVNKSDREPAARERGHLADAASAGMELRWRYWASWGGRISPPTKTRAAGTTQRPAPARAWTGAMSASAHNVPQHVQGFRREMRPLFELGLAHSLPLVARDLNLVRDSATLRVDGRQDVATTSGRSRCGSWPAPRYIREHLSSPCAEGNGSIDDRSEGGGALNTLAHETSNKPADSVAPRPGPHRPTHSRDCRNSTPCCQESFAELRMTARPC